MGVNEHSEGLGGNHYADQFLSPSGALFSL